MSTVISFKRSFIKKKKKKKTKKMFSENNEKVCFLFQVTNFILHFGFYFGTLPKKQKKKKKRVGKKELELLELQNKNERVCEVLMHFATNRMYMMCRVGTMNAYLFNCLSLLLAYQQHQQAGKKFISFTVALVFSFYCILFFVFVVERKIYNQNDTTAFISILFLLLNSYCF